MANAIIEKILNPLDKEILKKRADKFSIETCAKSYQRNLININTIIV